MTDDVRPPAGHDASNDVVTAGAAPPRSADPTPSPGPDTEPNGWSVGPTHDPDRYELLGVGVTGGEGVTWRARYRGGLHTPLPLALKVLRRAPDADPSWPGPSDRRRCQDQTALLRHLRLDHLVNVNEVMVGRPPHAPGEGEELAETLLIEMEWVEGPTLGALLRGRPASAADLRERVGFLRDVCQALASLHSHTATGGNPSLHRDLTPANCIVHATRGVVVVDVSTMQLPADGIDTAGRHTPAYSAPEVLADPSAPRGVPADLYAVGALTCFCLTGQDPPPASRPGARDAVRAHLDRLARRLALPRALSEHVMRMLSANPLERPADLAAWGDQLAQLASRRPRLARWASPRRLVAGIAAVAMIGATAGAAAVRGTSDRIAQTSVTTGVPTGSITFPTNGDDVPDCTYVSGRARPAGQTLVLATQNLTNGDPMHYVQYVFDWQHPTASWRGAVFLNQGAHDQEISIQLVAVDSGTARAAYRDADDYDVMDSLARGGTVLDEITVVRTSAPDHVTNCDEPS